MPAADLRPQIAAALAAFAQKPLRESSRALFKALGYSSERTLKFGSVAEFCQTYDSGGERLGKFAPAKNWASVDLLFQLTSEDIASASSGQLELAPSNAADLRQIESYLFVVLSLRDLFPKRAVLSEITRALNRLFPMPVLVCSAMANMSPSRLRIVARTSEIREGMW